MASTDTITALATGSGGAISLIRVSGPQAIRIADAIFRPATGVPLRDKEGYTISYGKIVDPASGELVDQVLVSLFRAPRSYTGEDMVEISAHASPYICKRLLDLLIAGGARPAEAGEFTVRAFLAGKMDLSQAEAVADMIASADRATHAMAVSQMRGGYSHELGLLREELLRLASLLELELDFSEEDVEFADRGQLVDIIDRLLRRIDALGASFSLGNVLKQGVPVAIAGEPNVGKSTLLNALLREDRAMVSDIAGTTRDVIEESIVLDGVRFRFLDTAGIRHTNDPLERMGIERTYDSIDRARIVLWMVDAKDYLASGAGSDSGAGCGNGDESGNDDRAGRGSGNEPGNDAENRCGLHPPFHLRPDQQLIVLVNKIDRLTTGQAANLHALDTPPAAQRTSHEASTAGNGGFPPVVPISARSGINMEAVTRLLLGCLELTPLYDGSAIVTHARHHEALLRSSESLARARESLARDLSGDLLAEDIRQALHYLGAITGEITTDEILGNIFSKFCIGK